MNKYTAEMKQKSPFDFMSHYEYECILTDNETGRQYSGTGFSEEEAKQKALEHAENSY